MSSSAQSATDPRRNNFDALRMALAVSVILSHSWPLLRGSNATEPLSVFTSGQLTFGELGVDCFFIVSGFLIAQSWVRSATAGSYFRKRILRIYPAFVVAVLLGAFVVAPIAVPGGIDISARSVGNVLLEAAHLNNVPVRGAFPDNPFPAAINGSLWSIRYEFWCYIGVALIGAVGMLARRRWVLVVFTASLAISLAFVVRKWNPGGSVLGHVLGSPAIWARMLPFFLAGTVYFLYRDTMPRSAFSAAVSLAALVAAAQVPPALTITLPIFGTHVVFWLALQARLGLHDFGRRGDFSYGVYLYAFPIQQLLVWALGPQMHPLMLFAIALPLSVAAGMLSWFLVERRFVVGRELPSLAVKTVPASAMNAAPAPGLTPV